MKKKECHIGLVDADLLDNGSRHPNLALLKIAGFLNDNGVDFELILDSNADISKYDEIYMSKVFTFSKEPDFYINASDEDKKKFHIGGTGYYANETSITKFRKAREEDMTRLEKDNFLLSFPNHRGGKFVNGIVLRCIFLYNIFRI